MDVDRNEIERRAREIWEAEGRPEGRAIEHWAQAEREFGVSPTNSEVLDQVGNYGDLAGLGRGGVG